MRTRPASISRRMLLANAAVLALAFVLLVVTPVTVSARISAAELAILFVGAIAMLALNWMLVRRALAPLLRLSEQMGEIDLHEGAVELPAAGSHVREVESVTKALATMVDRLALERRQASRAALAGQEGERLRVARELHDEVAQGLVAIALMAERYAAASSPDAAERFSEIASQIHFYLDELRRIARELRPEALDDLGLINALIALASASSERGLHVDRQLPPELTGLSDEQELVVYRIAQEALSNVARHSGAAQAAVTLTRNDAVLVLEVVDDGCGIGEDSGDQAGVGIKGMKERAWLVGGSLEVCSRRPSAGTRVELTVPLEGSH